MKMMMMMKKMKKKRLNIPSKFFYYFSCNVCGLKLLFSCPPIFPLVHHPHKMNNIQYNYSGVLIACLSTLMLIYGVILVIVLMRYMYATKDPNYSTDILPFNPFHLIVLTIASIHRIKFRRNKKMVPSFNTVMIFWSSFCALHYFGLDLPFEFPIWCILLFMTTMTTLRLVFELLFY